MRRSALLIVTGLSLVCFSGCHSHWWLRKHHQYVDYTNYDACGCGSTYAGSLDPGPIPLTHIISSSPGAVPGPPAAGFPGVATPAPPGTKLSTPVK